MLLIQVASKFHLSLEPLSNWRLQA